MIRALIVDDEPLGRRGIRVRLEREADVTIVGEAEDGGGAIAAIHATRPDLVFLDVQMPGMNGFQVLEGVAKEHLPMVVFVTAHDAHALRAFEINALDYLLKPYSEERFQESLRRARAKLASVDGAAAERERMHDMLAQLEARHGSPVDRPAQVFPTRFAVRERDRIVLVRIDDLLAIEAAANYVQLVETHRRHLLRLSLSEMEQQLDPAHFARVHRSTIVNVDRVCEIRMDPNGSGEIVMTGGASYRMSRAYRDKVFPRTSTPLR